MNSNELGLLFNDIQNCSTTKATQFIERALGMIEQSDCFLDIINRILPCKKSAIPSKVADFLYKLFERLNAKESPILESIFLYIYQFTDSKSILARRNALQMLNQIVEITDKRYIRKDVLEKIAERLFDKEKSVRKQSVKICMKFQKERLSGNMFVQHGLKDVLKFDSSAEIRRIVLNELEVSEITLNSILERAIDLDISIRKLFWNKIVFKIDIKALSHNKRVYILKRAFLERDFDATIHFYSLISDYTLDDFMHHFYCREKEYATVIVNYLHNTSETFVLDRFEHIYVDFMYHYYSHIEKSKGRDALDLMDLSNHLEILYQRATEEELNDPDQISVVKNLFKILEFYDIFTVESKKYILSILKRNLFKH